MISKHVSSFKDVAEKCEIFTWVYVKKGEMIVSLKEKFR